MAEFFQFEADFVESLRCIPMQVRFKLDTCGIKLKLTQWHQLANDDRQALVHRPCETQAEIEAYRDFLCHLVRESSGVEASELAVDPNPPWNIGDRIPDNVREKTQTLGAIVTPKQWKTLTSLQRFALIKLSRSSHENNNFLPALVEFRLM